MEPRLREEIAKIPESESQRKPVLKKATEIAMGSRFSATHLVHHVRGLLLDTTEDLCDMHACAQISADMRGDSLEPLEAP